MLLSLHVYSNWYSLHSVEMDSALGPTSSSSFFAMESVESNVP